MCSAIFSDCCVCYIHLHTIIFGSVISCVGVLFLILAWLIRCSSGFLVLFIYMYILYMPITRFMFVFIFVYFVAIIC